MKLHVFSTIPFFSVPEHTATWTSQRNWGARISYEERRAIWPRSKAGDSEEGGEEKDIEKKGQDIECCCHVHNWPFGAAQKR
jgi:hypothetical protein